MGWLARAGCRSSCISFHPIARISIRSSGYEASCNETSRTTESIPATATSGRPLASSMAFDAGLDMAGSASVTTAPADFDIQRRDRAQYPGYSRRPAGRLAVGSPWAGGACTALFRASHHSVSLESARLRGNSRHPPPRSAPVHLTTVPEPGPLRVFCYPSRYPNALSQVVNQLQVFVLYMQSYYRS
jgi:hypothetical protein